MSSSKRGGRVGRRHAWADLRAWPRAVKYAFVADAGGLRVAWRLVVAVAAYLVWTNGITALLAHAFDALFDAWGVTALNLRYAPRYARWLADHYGNIISVVSSAGIAVFAYLAAPARGELRFKPMRLLTGAAIGFGAVGIAAALMLALDSVRMTAASPRFTWSPLILLPVLLSAAIAEELFARGYVLRMVKSRANRPLSYFASTLIFFYATGAHALGVLGIVNMLLLSVLLCAASEKWTSWLTAGLRFGWSYAVTCAFGFPGVSGGTPVFAIYSVSEGWLTGGTGGLIGGLYMTSVLAAAVLLLLCKGTLHLKRKASRR